ncbi:DUF1642 domain-containing protein [Lactococcus lactis]|uniref:DUF1642 domain-containing protein n=1 Tax=Lactococcus lactis TaxID=1358 RepID=UPI00071CFF18|nr:DUF1642 domain-containing protein [Lactococcus lactis]KST98361.1 Phage protein [Lactococcus lactis subsp. lactis]
MTKFEEEFKALTSWDWVNVDLIQKILTKFGNWHSDEEFQEIKESYWNQAESILSMLDEIKSLKSQLQQQALPVVPEFVAEWIECVKGKNKNALALLDDDNMPDDMNEWLFFQRNDDNINLIIRAWLNGYQVEKPQLFYLKNKLTGAYLYYDEATKLYSDIVGNVEDFFGTKTKFTEAEIDSMQTGSYEQIEVEK